MKLRITVIAMLITGSLFAQKLDKKEAEKPVLKISSDTAKLSAKAIGDTLIISKAAFLKLPNGVLIKTDQLQKILGSSYLTATDQYWFALFNFMKTSKNPNFSSDELDQLIQPWMGYVNRYQQMLQAQSNQQQSKQ